MSAVGNVDVWKPLTWAHGPRRAGDQSRAATHLAYPLPEPRFASRESRKGRYSCPTFFRPRLIALALSLSRSLCR
eukprot:2001309-Rhodomonas_salina.1